MKKIVIFVSLLLFLHFAGFPEEIKYYRVDQVKTIRGKITAIKNEECYYKSIFTVIYLEEKKSGKIYRVEVSPQWFFSMDLMVGGIIEVTGAHGKAKDMNLVMTGTITFQGEVHRFRDKNGFPLWRGKGRKMKWHIKRKMKRRGRR